MNRETAAQICAKIKSLCETHAIPYVNAKFCPELAGKGFYVLWSLSLDKQEDWPNAIFENSRFFKMIIDDPCPFDKGNSEYVIECNVARDYNARPRRSTVKGLDKLSAKLEKVIVGIKASTLELEKRRQKAKEEQEKLFASKS